MSECLDDQNLIDKIGLWGKAIFHSVLHNSTVSYVWPCSTVTEVSLL